MRTYQMKFYLIILIPVIFSCKTVSYFETPNYLRNLPATIYLTNGQEMEGRININTENLMGAPVKFYDKGDQKPMHFKLTDLRGYRINNEYYAVKALNTGLGKQYVFMKRITPEDSNIQMFEHMEKQVFGENRKNRSNSYQVRVYQEIPGEELTEFGIRNHCCPE